MLKLFLFSIFLALIAIFFGPKCLNFFSKDSNMLTKSDLKLYNGVDRPLLYLSILGKVFDVTKGVQHYGPGAPYNSFIGKDASRSFVTGQFDDPNSESVADLSLSDLRSLNHWIRFYNKEYKRVGESMRVSIFCINVSNF